MDFYLCGTVKDKVFARKPRTVENMAQFIFEACQETDVDNEFCSRVCMSVRSRLEKCVKADSKNFEYLRD